jgi:hypothetical protein
MPPISQNNGSKKGKQTAHRPSHPPPDVSKDFPRACPRTRPLTPAKVAQLGKVQRGRPWAQTSLRYEGSDAEERSVIMLPHPRHGRFWIQIGAVISIATMWEKVQPHAAPPLLQPCARHVPARRESGKAYTVEAHMVFFQLARGSQVCFAP